MKRWAYFLLAMAALPVAAQTDDDGPGRGVARISVINGEVSVKRGDSGDLVAAAINAPLVVSDRLLTGTQSRAELQFDWANMIRLGPDSEVRLGQLENQRYQIQVAIGTTTFRVLRDSKADVEISTPNVAVRPVKRGVYRITVREDGTSEITVRSGEAEIFTPRGSERLRAGKTMIARGTASDPEFQIVAAIPGDDWDSWNQARDRDLESSRSYQYVASDVYGAEDLDHHGRWVYDPDYGYVWAPAVAAGWAPYRYGRWSWVDYYGWTWVSYDQWGWAPYHYGRWFYGPRYGWCWWPGGRGSHYWRPALVAFFGWGGYSGASLGFGFGWGNVGWVPLAPYEAFYPWYGPRWYGGYRGRGGYVNNTVIVNNTNVYNVYRNARISNSITAVNSDSFGRRGVTNADLVRVHENDLRSAGLVRGALPMAPDRQSLHMADRQVRAADLPRTAENRSFYSQRQTPQVERVPFDQQRQTMEQVARRTLTAEAGGSATPAARGAAPGAQSPAVNGANVSERGWRSASEQPRTATTDAPQVRAPESAVRSGSEPQQTRNAVSNDSGSGWRRATDSEGQRTVQPTDRGNRGGSGWRTFGDPSNRTAPAVAAPQSDALRNSPSSRTETNGRRFGDTGSGGRTESSQPRSEQPRMDRQSAPVERSSPPAADTNWRRFGDTGGTPRSEQPRMERQSAPVERSSPPAVDRPTRNESSPPSGGGRQESARPGRERSDNSSGWQKFNGSGSEGSRTSSISGARSFDSTPRSAGGGGSSSEAVRISPPIVRERPSSGFGGGGGGSWSAPRMSSPPPSGSGGGGGRSAASAPSVSRGGGGGGGGSASHAGGGGGARSGGGGGGRSR